MKLTISGQTVSQKNSKAIVKNRRTGKMFIMSNSRVKEWQRVALLELSAVKDRFIIPIKIDYLFYVKDNRKRDLDNMIASVNDVLQASEIISGDHWQVLEIGSAKATVDKEYPRCELLIMPLNG